MGLILVITQGGNSDQGMECIVCGGDSGGHRVVVAADESETRGGFCHSCESSVFGRCLERYEPVTDDGCIVCDAPGDYRFYDWLERVDADSTLDSSDLADPDQPTPPALCSTHFQALASDSIQWVETPQIDHANSDR